MTKRQRLQDLEDLLESYGSRFAGNSVEDAAEEWYDHDFSLSEADAWCAIGVWDAATAAEFRLAEATPNEVLEAAEDMVAGLDDPAEEYTDGDPIYACCNGDVPTDAIIAHIAE